MAKSTKSLAVPKNMQETYTAIVAMTDEFSKQHLNQEYALLAQQATAALCRKRPSPLATGKPNSWACGIIYALGFVNFLFDKSKKPFVSAGDLCAYFDISKSTGAAKSKTVRDALDLSQFDPNWCLPSLLDANPLAWMVQVNGVIVDARSLPKELLEMAFQKGLIPYIPKS